MDQQNNGTPNENDPTAPKAGPVMRLYNRITGVIEEILRQCPKHDWDNVRAVGEIMLFTWLYQTALFVIISHRLFAAPGKIRPELVVASMFIATFILLIDSYMFMRSGWHLSGIEELKRGGLDVSGGPAVRIKAGFFLAIRVALSIGLAQLTAIFLSLIIFGADIDARVQATYQTANAHLVADATALVDADIQRAAVAMKTQGARVDTLSAQITRLRQNDIDPSAGSAQVQEAQQEITALLSEKAKADQAVQTAETFEEDERGGIKGTSTNSGLPGDGPRAKAARAEVENAKNHSDEVANELTAARGRLEALRKQLTTEDRAKEQRSHGELPGYEATLSTEEAKLASLKQQLADLTNGRDEAIRKAVENAPDYVPLSAGFLSQVVALEHIAQEDGKIATVILLIDLVSFGFELAAVLAKVLSYIPTTYAVLLARDAYMDVVRIVNGMMTELDQPPPANDNGIRLRPPTPANDNESNSGSSSGSDPFGSPGNHPPLPKRKRGRPRKYPRLN